VGLEGDKCDFIVIYGDDILSPDGHTNVALHPDHDSRTLQRCISGPGVPADPDCAS
jgi:hypothetical protein